MAAPSTQSVPLHLTATVSPRWAQAIRATSPKAPLPRWRRKARSAHGTRGRQPLAMDGDVVAGGTPAGVQGGDVTAGVPWYMQACQGGSGTRWLRCGCRFTETCAKTCPQGNLERPGPAQLWFGYQAKAAQLLGKLDLGFPGFSCLRHTCPDFPLRLRKRQATRPKLGRRGQLQCMVGLRRDEDSRATTGGPNTLLPSQFIVKPDTTCLQVCYIIGMYSESRPLELCCVSMYRAYTQSNGRAWTEARTRKHPVAGCRLQLTQPDSGTFVENKVQRG